MNSLKGEKKLWVNCVRFYGHLIDGTYKSICKLSQDELMDVIIKNGQIQINYNDGEKDIITTPEEVGIKVEFNNLWICLSDSMKKIVEDKLIKNGYTKTTKYTGGNNYRVCPLAINGIAKLTYNDGHNPRGDSIWFIQEYKSKNGTLIREKIKVYPGYTEMWTSTGWTFKYGSINAWNFPPITGGRKKYTTHRHRKIKRTYKV